MVELLPELVHAEHEPVEQPPALLEGNDRSLFGEQKPRGQRLDAAKWQAMRPATLQALSAGLQETNLLNALFGQDDWRLNDLSRESTDRQQIYVESETTSLLNASTMARSLADSPSMDAQTSELVVGAPEVSEKMVMAFVSRPTDWVGHLRSCNLVLKHQETKGDLELPPPEVTSQRVQFVAPVDHSSRSMIKHIAAWLMDPTIQQRVPDVDDGIEIGVMEEAREEGFPEPGRLSIWRARTILSALNWYWRSNAEIYPTADSEVALDFSIEKGSSVVVLCDSDGQVLCLSHIGGVQRSRRIGMLDGDPAGFVIEQLSLLVESAQ